ncbi:MAG: HEAT repeat domain-containing protein [Planctomycetaceae bacterium]|nr:HEAT repeat domain-containing protein [Planctomycetaceae bacterium]MBL4886064.1 HEAT repeat domain-containing protein [Planctomycetaceae bacterium]
MNLNRTHLLLLHVSTSVCLTLGLATESSADLIRLKHGGEVRGKITPQELAYPNRLSIKTVSGATVSVSTQEVDFITRRSLAYEEYEIQVRLTSPDIESLWGLTQWCMNNRLKPQREKHLYEILKLSPEHEQAHIALRHVRREGKWATHAEHMLSRGYVRHRGKFITPEEKSLLENTEADRVSQQQWYARIHLWANWLTGRYEKQRAQAVEQIQSIRDPQAVPALRKIFADQPSRDIRLLYINVLARIDAPSAITALVVQGIYDSDQGVRQRAISSVPESQLNLANQVLIGHLSNQENVIVRRAASALLKTGDKQAIPHLIDALVTSHKYRIEVNAPAVGFTMGPGGNVSQGLQGHQLPPEIMAGLLTGQIPPENISWQGSGPQAKQLRTVRIDQQNPEVLETLKSLTSTDFGYDERTWKLWWLSQNS